MSEPTSRRELNKARTHRALVDAARELGQEHGLENVTAEDIADRAGVSRRTFFNYFSGIEGVVAAGMAESLDRIAAALRRRPLDEQPLDAIAAALRDEPLPAEILLGWIPPTAPSSGRGHELHGRVWQHHADWLVALLRERLDDGVHDSDDELRVRSLAAAVMGIFEVVQTAWLPTAVGREPQDAVAEFNRELLRALGHAGSGWQRPRPQP